MLSWDDALRANLRTAARPDKQKPAATHRQTRHPGRTVTVLLEEEQVTGTTTGCGSGNGSWPERKN
jgi:hypothetical protein